MNLSDFILKSILHSGDKYNISSTKPNRAGPRLGRRRSGLRRRHTVCRARGDSACRTQSQVFRYRPWRDVLQPHLQPVYGPKRHHRAGHLTRQPGLARGGPRAADRIAAHPIQSPAGRYRWHPLLANRSAGRLRRTQRYYRQRINTGLIVRHWDDLLRLGRLAKARPGAGPHRHAHLAGGRAAREAREGGERVFSALLFQSFQLHNRSKLAGSLTTVTDCRDCSAKSPTAPESGADSSHPTSYALRYPPGRPV